MKLRTRFLLWIGSVLLAAVLLFLLLTQPSKRTLFPRHTLRIKDTPALVREVRSLSTLVSACYYDEVVLKATKSRSVNAFGTSLPLPVDEICIISRGKAQAGIDLSKLSDDALLMRGDTVMVTLPAPELFEVILNPSDYEIFVEDGKWSHEEVVAIESRAKETIRRDALKAGLLDKASESAGRQIDRLLRSFGYREVVVVPHSLPLPSPEGNKE